MADVVVESAPADDNDDWLYGESNAEQREDQGPEESEKAPPTSTEAAEGEEKEQEEVEGNNDDDEHFADVARDEAANGDADSQENGDSDSDDSDDVKVTIGEIKPQAYASLNIKRGVGLLATGTAEKPRAGTVTGGKVSLEDFDGPGSINGVPAMEFNIDTIEDKPWNKPGADISDYFNYGFNEVTWSAYCERQRRMRVNEAGVGMHPGPAPRPPPPDMRRQPGPMRIDDGMPPPPGNSYQSRENTIQVMTAERREYGRREPGAGEYFPPAPAPAPAPDHYYPPHHAPHAPHPPHAPYDEPWGHPEPSGWAPTDIKELTPGPMGPAAMGPPLGLTPPPVASPYAPPYRPHPHPHQLPPHPHPHPHAHPHMHERERERERERDRMREREERERRERDRRDEFQDERDRDRERSRSIKPDRIREKSYRRERSRSRSRRHKSRSRSPRLRERSRSPRPRERTRSPPARPRERSRERERSRDRSVKPRKSKERKEKDEDK